MLLFSNRLKKLPALSRHLTLPFSSCILKLKNTEKFSPLLNHSSKRTFFSRLLRGLTQNEIKAKDNIPKEYTLIYRSTLTKYVNAIQIFTFVSSTVLILLYCLKSETTAYYQNYESWTWTKRSRKLENEEFYYVIIFTCLVVALSVSIGRLPMRIYKQPQSGNYTFIFNGVLPLTTKHVNAAKETLFRVEERGILPWRSSRYQLNLESEQKPIILFDHFFRRPSDLYIMLGEQNDTELD